MKQILLILVCLLVHGCNHYISGDDVKLAINKCKSNDGIQSINIGQNPAALIQCNNNALLKMGETRMREIDKDSALTKEKLDICLSICDSNDGLKHIIYGKECKDKEEKNCTKTEHTFVCQCNNDIFGNL